MTEFLIAYGSQTGQAEAIAGQIKERAESLGLTPSLHVLNGHESKFHLEKEKLAVIVVSSTGDGDPPENCDRFVRKISRKTLEPGFLKDLEYAILGLGDSNYSTYQGVPRKIDKQLKFLGAEKILETGEADDQIGLELAVEPWIEKLFNILAERFGISQEKLSSLFDSKLKFNAVKTKEEKELLAQTISEDAREEPHNEYSTLKIVPQFYPDNSIIKGDVKLSLDNNLRVPIAPQDFLVSSFSHKKHSVNTSVWQNGAKMPGVVSAPFNVTVVGTALVTDHDVQKPKREIIIDLGEHEAVLPYEPGDAFYFIAPNNVAEVNFILKRLGLLDLADNEWKIAVDTNTKKLKAVVPPHIPEITTLRHLFTYCLDIRRAPGRPLLRIFADSAKKEEEKRRLLELCSAQGMNDFTLHIRQAGLSVVDVLYAFPSVKPNVDRLLELLPRLMPRPYSVATAKKRRVRFVYSVMTFTAEEGRCYERQGVATEWLNTLKVGDRIQIMGKEPARFRLPPPPLEASSVASMPILMIGPGTGVAVFLSFCQHLLQLKLSDPEHFPNVPRYLYFGCRHLNKDFIYKEEIESYVREGILSQLIICESQGASDPNRSKYVQDALKERSSEVNEFLNITGDHPSRVFICGDAKGMSKDVWAAFQDIIQQTKGIPEAEAKAVLTDLKKSDRYIEDVWS
ncbi:unnamed protein product [Auanema sp. JU1783]|nr:unnamed protein product [Auanema sp. JU1783]